MQLQWTDNLGCALDRDQTDLVQGTRPIYRHVWPFSVRG